MKRMKSWKWSILLVVLISLALLTQAALAVQYNLDDFSATTMVANLSTISGSVSLADGDSLSGLLGGERDLVLTYEAGSQTVELGVDTTAENLAYNSGTNGSNGHFSVTWDGNDDDALTNAYALNVDLTQGGVNDAFLLNVTSDGPFDLTLTVYSEFDAYGHYTINETEDIDGVGRSYWIPFADFTTDMGTLDFGNGADPDDVDAVVLEVDPGVEDDFSVDFIETRDSSETIIDFGDLPASYNITVKADNGAGHVNPGATIELRNTEVVVDSEADGQESVDATGDAGDEGGVVPTGNWADNSGHVDVYVSGGNGCLMGWLDWHAGSFSHTADGPDSSFDDNLELIIDNQLVSSTANPNSFTFTILGLDTSNTVFARFRIVPDIGGAGCGDQSALNYTSLVDDGEVEDYEWSFNANAVTLSSLDAHSGVAMPTAFALIVATLAGGAGLFVLSRRRKA